MSAELATAQGSGQTLDKQLSEARATMEKYLRDYDTLFNRTQKLTEDLEDQVCFVRLGVSRPTRLLFLFFSFCDIFPAWGQAVGNLNHGGRGNLPNVQLVSRGWCHCAAAAIQAKARAPPDEATPKKAVPDTCCRVRSIQTRP